MPFHLVFGSPIDLAATDQRALLGDGPRHVMSDLARRLGAQVHHPGPSAPPIWSDHLNARLIGQPCNWALARQLAGQLKADDVVYCTGEDVGLPLAHTAARAGVAARIVVFIHSMDRPRGRLAMQILRSKRAINLFVTNCAPQVAYLQGRAGIEATRVWMLPEQTDTEFFSPGPVSPEKRRPLIVSVGLEKRDYRSLAAATQDLDVDVRISAFSADVPALKRSMPAVLPGNMTQRFYSWRELQQLYRDADIIVVPIFESVDSAGVTSLIEAMASGRPVIVTRSPGLADYQQNTDALSIVPAEDPQALRQAITRLLADPQAAARQAAQALDLARRLHGSEVYIDALVERLTAISRQAPHA